MIPAKDAKQIEQSVDIVDTVFCLFALRLSERLLVTDESTQKAIKEEKRRLIKVITQIYSEAQKNG